MNNLLCVEKGRPQPYGTYRLPKGVNFSIFSKEAKKLRLNIFCKPQEEEPTYSILLDPLFNRTGDVWHITLSPLPEQFAYSYQVNDQKEHLLDPHAKALWTPNSWMNLKDHGNAHPWKHPPWDRPLAYCPKPVEFDWEGIPRPQLAMEDVVIYEMHVRGFTKASSCETDYPGTFAGLREKIPYLKDLGVTAVELLPIQEFNEAEYDGKNPETGEALCNYWGYSTINFFSLCNRYAWGKRPEDTIREFKELVKELHRNKIEVYLDVVFNHTAEGNELGPTLSYRGLGDDIYYMKDRDGNYKNYSGCGNTLNCNQPVSRALIHSNLRYWVTEMQVDGFRFDLASILGRASDGTPLAQPPLLELIALDPILSRTKLMAEAWDAGGLYQVGSFPSWNVWTEWNGEFRDSVRRFLKGDPNQASTFATRMCGSQDLYHSGRSPLHSINFITAHDGFTLSDQVSYNERHNWANGESNRDGHGDNASWNCGVEGPTDDPEILALRKRQMKNFLIALFMARGVPMLHMGDEIGHSKKGNNNTWCQDNELNYFPWDKLEKEKDLHGFVKRLIRLRLTHPLFRNQNEFLKEGEIQWHAWEPHKPLWRADARLLAFTLIHQEEEKRHLYVAFNAHASEQTIEVPASLEGQWHWLIHSAHIEMSGPLEGLHINLPPYSSIVLESRRLDLGLRPISPFRLSEKIQSF